MVKKTCYVQSNPPGCTWKTNFREGEGRGLRCTSPNLISIRQLRLHLNNAGSLDLIRTDLELNCSFLVWAGLRSAIPVTLRGKENDVRLTNVFYDNNTLKITPCSMIITPFLMPL